MFSDWPSLRETDFEEGSWERRKRCYGNGRKKFRGNPGYYRCLLTQERSSKAFSRSVVKSPDCMGKKPGKSLRLSEFLLGQFFIMGL